MRDVRARLEALDDVKVAELNRWELPGSKRLRRVTRDLNASSGAGLSRCDPHRALTVEVHECAHDATGPESESREANSLSAA
jgi:hypothetical protein